MSKAAVKDRERMSMQWRAEYRGLSARDSLRVQDLLEHPTKPNAKLLAAARELLKKP